MNLLSTTANLAWAAASLPAARRFRRALAEPERAQQTVLRRLVAENAMCAFGREHDLAAIRSYADYAARVPLATYEELVPMIDRIRQGESSVLTAEAVTRLVPTSGTSSARKLIPCTAGLQREFNAAIDPWMLDLFRTEPSLLGGSAYWSISPLASADAGIASTVPIGFEDDAAYLGTVRRKLVEAVMAVPASVRHVRDVAAFRRATLVALVRRRDLRLISVWHPSFLTLLLDELIASWPDLVRAAGVSSLQDVDPSDVRAIWPHLRMVSCWTDGHAGLAADDLARRLPGVRLQGKGLFATEAVVTIPFGNARPVAVTSHFFEFIAESGEVCRVEQLREGVTYEVVVSTGGGLWRYRLGDRVVVDRFVARTPSLRFLGRVGGVSDRCGEKLSEMFVAGVIRELTAGGPAPRFAMLAPEEDPGGCRYILYLEGDGNVIEVANLDTALRANPHYAWCRDLGQLGEPRLFMIRGGGFAAFARRAIERGCRWGDVKPVALATEGDWSRHFDGEIVEHVAIAPW